MSRSFSGHLTENTGMAVKKQDSDHLFGSRHCLNAAMWCEIMVRCCAKEALRAFD
jgi:hypothetical protein